VNIFDYSNNLSSFRTPENFVAQPANCNRELRVAAAEKSFAAERHRQVWIDTMPLNVVAKRSFVVGKTILEKGACRQLLNC
jgi:hypothetical protein